MTIVGTTLGAGGGGNAGDNLGMSSTGARYGGPDLGQQRGHAMNEASLAARQHFVVPSQQADNLEVPTRRDTLQSVGRGGELRDVPGFPSYYNQYDGMPVPYTAPSQAKENFILRSAIRDAAGSELANYQRGEKGTGVIRTDPITPEEVQYLKSELDMAKLAKFDKYVETYIDPRKPGNMKWLMEIYPDYVERRLQQTHTDYEYALRNQMIDQWGINTFDDLHFKFMVDQGEIAGPSLQNPRPPLDDTYTPGILSPYNMQSSARGSNKLYLPFARANHGRRPANADDWAYDRGTAKDPLGTGNTPSALARGMYGLGSGPRRIDADTRTWNPFGGALNQSLFPGGPGSINNPNNPGGLTNQ